MTESDTPRLLEILLVEDSPTDRLLTLEALKEAKILNSLNVVEDGVQAMAYLRREGQYSSAVRPGLILLDLNLPKKDGREVLEEIKADPFLKYIPVVVMTSSEADADIVTAYGSYASGYVTKPVNFMRFAEALRTLEIYWLEVVTLPSESSILRMAQPTPRAPQPGLRQSISGHLRILLIEDNPADVLLIEDALLDSRTTSFEVVHAERLTQARKLLETQGFDAILTDLGLPDSQGLETYAEIRASAAALPIIVLTGLDDDGLGMSALREGAQDYLVKGQMNGSGLGRAIRYAIDKKNTEDQLLHLQRMDAIGQLASGVAHDFNNILTVIQGHAELLQSPGTTPQEIVEFAVEISEAAERGANLTRQMLTFSRRQVVHLQPINLNNVVGNFASMLRRILGESIRFEVRLAAELPDVLADWGMLEQIVLNLAVNARDAMPSGGQLTVQTAVLDMQPNPTQQLLGAYIGRFVRLSISDTGCGIPPELLSHIFEPFFTTKEVGKGTGLGLATVFGIVQQHRGWLQVSSQPNAGSCFEIYLPARAEAAITPCRKTPVPHNPMGKETILLVEDQDIVRKLAKTALQRQGYTVIEAPTGAVALALWKTLEKSVDILFTDMVMPEGITGRQLAEELQVLKPELKVLYTSGYSKDFVSEGFSLQEGANFLQKPYSLDHLLKTVRAALDQAPSGI